MGWLLKKRYRLGFAFGKFEHRTREFGYVFLLGGVVTLYFELHSTALFLCGAALVLETISYIAHRLEKATMDSIRFGKKR